MDTKTLSTLANHLDNTWQPVIFDAANAEGRKKLDELLASGAVREVSDTLDELIEELLSLIFPISRPLVLSLQKPLRLTRKLI